MEKKNNFEALRALLERRDYHALQAALAEENEVDIAEFMEELTTEQATVVFRTLPKELAAEVFSNLSPENQQAIRAPPPTRSCPPLWRSSYVDDAVDMLEELPANVVKRVLQERPAGHPQAHQPVPQLPGELGGQHHDRRVHRT